MTPSTIPTVSYRRDPSPAPTIFLFEAEPTSPPASSQQTLTTDSSTLYIPFFSYSNWHHSKGDLKMPIAHLAHRPSPCLPAGRSTPPPQQILTADRRPSYMVCLLSAPRTRSEDDPAASEKRLHIQLNRTATLLAKVRVNPFPLPLCDFGRLINWTSEP